MATSKDFLSYLSEQFANSPDLTFKPMMGEYLMYYRGKLVGDVCDNRVLIKPVAAAKEMLPEAEMQPPYVGAKPMILLENLDDGGFMQTLFEAMLPELPEPKPRKKKNC